MASEKSRRTSLRRSAAAKKTSYKEDPIEEDEEEIVKEKLSKYLGDGGNSSGSDFESELQKSRKSQHESSEDEPTSGPESDQINEEEKEEAEIISKKKPKKKPVANQKESVAKKLDTSKKLTPSARLAQLNKMLSSQKGLKNGSNKSCPSKSSGSSFAQFRSKMVEKSNLNLSESSSDDEDQPIRTNHVVESRAKVRKKFSPAPKGGADDLSDSSGSEDKEKVATQLESLATSYKQASEKMKLEAAAHQEDKKCINLLASQSLSESSDDEDSGKANNSSRTKSKSAATKKSNQLEIKKEESEDEEEEIASQLENLVRSQSQVDEFATNCKNQTSKSVGDVKDESSADESEMASQLENLVQSQKEVSEFARVSETSKVGKKTPGKSRKKTSKNTNASSDIKSLLAMGEGIEGDDYLDHKSSSDDEEESQSQVPSGGIEIAIEVPNKEKRKKKGFDVEAYLKRELSKVQREVQLTVHQTHILCLVTHLRHLNRYVTHNQRVCHVSASTTLSIALSVVPPIYALDAKNLNIVALSQFVYWFRDNFPVTNPSTFKGASAPSSKAVFPHPLDKWLQKSFENFACESREQLVMAFITAARALGWKVRIVLNFETAPLKPAKGSNEDSDDSTEKNEASTSSKSANRSTNKKPANKTDVETGATEKENEKGRRHSQKRKSSDADELTNRKKVKKSEPKIEKKTEDKKDGGRKRKSEVMEAEKSPKPSTSKSSEDLKIKKEIESESEPLSKVVKPSAKNAKPSKAKVIELSARAIKEANKRKISSARSREIIESSASESEDDELEKVSKTANQRKSDKQPAATTIKAQNKEIDEDPKNKDSTSKSGKESTSIKSTNKPSSKKEEKETSNLKITSKAKTSTAKKDDCRTKSSKEQTEKQAKEQNSGKTETKSKECTSKNDSKSKHNPSSKKPSELSKKPSELPRKEQTEKQSKEHNSKTDGKSKNESKTKSSLGPKQNTSSKNVPERPAKGSSSSRNRSKASYKGDSTSDSSDDEDTEMLSKKKSRGKKSSSQNVSKSKSKRDEGEKSKYFTNESSDDFEEKPITKKITKAPKPQGKTVTYWAEILTPTHGWVTVDVIHGRVNCTSEMESLCLKPILYIVACNSDGTVKDLTKKYVSPSTYLTNTRKLRVSQEWLDGIFVPLSPKPTPDNKAEDDKIEKQLLSAPMPSTVSAFKGHPLYVLSRHLLKFEAIYPENAPPLGFVRKEPVYARDCVHTCHCRVTWLKEGRAVRIGEEPYKIVKARPKWDRMSGTMVKDQPLEVFGKWQTEIYIPPPAKDGKVPRNEYGNVELFKPWMLPKGTVHIPIVGLNRVAKKLNIDCAPAMIGWEFSGVSCHPVFDGFVVCEEFSETLMDAWNVEIEEKNRKEAEKKEKRVLDNWKKLIKGMLMHQKIRNKYLGKDTS